MTKRQELELAVKGLLFEVPLSERITIIERIGKQYRQQNSIETNRETNEFKRKMGLMKKAEDYSPIMEKNSAKDHHNGKKL